MTHDLSRLTDEQLDALEKRALERRGTAAHVLGPYSLHVIACEKARRRSGNAHREHPRRQRQREERGADGRIVRQVEPKI